MSANSTAPAARPGWRAWAGLAVLSLPTTLQALDVTVLYLALPHLSTDLGATATERLWIIDVYGFMVAGLLVLMGTLGDRIGRRRLLLLGATAFGAASVLAAYSTTPEMLIAARVMLGIAGATLMPSTLALISTMFTDPRQRGPAFGVWATSFSAGVALGPILGGLMLEFFWWGSVFLLAVPVMALLLATAPFLLPEYRAPEPGRLDLPGVLLSMAAVLSVVFGLKRLAGYGPEPEALAAIAAGVVLGLLFVRRQRRSSDPLLDLRLFSGAAFSSALAVMLLGLLLIGGVYLFVTQYLQSVAGLSPLVAGLWLLPSATGLVVASTLAPVLARRVRPAYVLAGSLALATLGFLLLTRVGPEDGLVTVVVGFTLVYAGISPIMALGTDLIVGSAPPEKAGASAAISETAMEAGVALGIAAFGSVGTAVYRLSMAGAMPAGVSADAAADASDGLEGAGRAAADLPAPVARDLLDTAAAAFTSSLTTVAWISAALAVGIAVLAAVALRRVPPTGAAEAEEGAPAGEPSTGEPVAG